MTGRSLRKYPSLPLPRGGVTLRCSITRAPRLPQCGPAPITHSCSFITIKTSQYRIALYKDHFPNKYLKENLCIEFASLVPELKPQHAISMYHLSFNTFNYFVKCFPNF